MIIKCNKLIRLTSISSIALGFMLSVVHVLDRTLLSFILSHNFKAILIAVHDNEAVNLVDVGSM